MSSGSFEKNSLDWQLQLVQRQFGEWWELKMSQVPLDQPQGSLPSWLLSSILGRVCKVKISLWNCDRYHQQQEKTVCRHALGKVIRITFWFLVAVILSWLGVRLFRGLHPYIISEQNNLCTATVKTDESLKSVFFPDFRLVRLN